MSDKELKIRELLVNKVNNLRRNYLKEIESAESDIDKLSSNIHNSYVIVLKDDARSNLMPWIIKAENHSLATMQFYLNVTNKIKNSGVHPSSIRASVNRKGMWYNFNYYDHLAISAVENTNNSFGKLLEEISILIENMLSQKKIDIIYPLLDQIKQLMDMRIELIFEKVSEIGRKEYEDILYVDNKLWSLLYDEWGKGSGYKISISNMSEEWFESKYMDCEKAVVDYVNKEWNKLIVEIKYLLQ